MSLAFLALLSLSMLVMRLSGCVSLVVQGCCQEQGPVGV